MKEKKLNRARTQMHAARARANQAEQQKRLHQEKISELKIEVLRLKKENAALQKLNTNLLTKIQDDAFAITFQTMGQYRSALMKLSCELESSVEKFLTQPKMTAAFENISNTAKAIIKQQTIKKESKHENI